MTPQQHKQVSESNSKALPNSHDHVLQQNHLTISEEPEAHASGAYLLHVVQQLAVFKLPVNPWLQRYQLHPSFFVVALRAITRQVASGHPGSTVQQLNLVVVC